MLPPGPETGDIQWPWCQHLGLVLLQAGTLEARQGAVGNPSSRGVPDGSGLRHDAHKFNHHQHRSTALAPPKLCLVC